MKKKVTYEGVQYEITSKPFAYSDTRFIVNGEESSTYIPNKQLHNIEAFSRYATLAIQEYIDRHTAQKAFKDWDGKL